MNPRAGESECQVYLGQWDWNTRDYRKVFFGNLVPPLLYSVLHDSVIASRLSPGHKL